MNHHLPHQLKLHTINLSPPQPPPNQNHHTTHPPGRGNPMKKNKKNLTLNSKVKVKAIEKVGISMATTHGRVCTTNDKPAISRPCRVWIKHSTSLKHYEKSHHLHPRFPNIVNQPPLALYQLELFRLHPQLEPKEWREGR